MDRSRRFHPRHWKRQSERRAAYSPSDLNARVERANQGEKALILSLVLCYDLRQ
jgi:hypothetical protein